jgi:hypothetical protein
MLCLMVCTSYHLLSEIWLLLFTVQVSRHITKNQHFGGTGEGAGNQLTCEAVTTSGTEDCRGKRREREREGVTFLAAVGGRIYSSGRKTEEEGRRVALKQERLSSTVFFLSFDTICSIWGSFGLP